MNSELMALIMNLNESVKVLGTRFEYFSKGVEDRLNKFETEMILLKSKVEFVEKNSLH